MSERKNRYAVRALPLRPKGRSFTALVDKNLSADEKDYFKLELLERNNSAIIIPLAKTASITKLS